MKSKLGRLMLILSSFVVGLAIVGLGWFIAGTDVMPRAYFAGSLASLGATVLPAAVLFYFGRRLESDQKEIRQSVSRVEKTVAEALERLPLSVERLDEVAAQDRAAEAQASLGVYADLQADVTYEHLRNAVRSAASIGVIDAGRGLVVPAGASFDSPRLRFKLVEGGRYEEMAWEEEVVISYVCPSDDYRTPRSIDVHWYADSNLSFVDVMGELHRAMMRDDRIAEATATAPAAAIAILAETLADGTRARYGLPDGLFTRRTVLEVIQTDHLLTVEGIEVHGHGLVLGGGQFLDPYEAHPLNPRRPDAVAEGMWELVRDRAIEQYFAPYHGAAGF